MDLTSFAVDRDVYAQCEDELRSAIRSRVHDPDFTPDFMIIGAPRAGTTYLSAALNQVMDAFVVPDKELKFFSANLVRFSYAWYLSRFAGGLGKLKGEATPSYASLPTSRIQLIYEMNPRMKLIYILREPCDRLASEWKYVFQKRNNWSEHEIASYVLSDGPVVMSDYAENLRRWLSVFPKEQMLILFHDHLINDTRGLLSSVSDFLELSVIPNSLGVESFNQSWVDQRVHHVVNRACSALFAPRIQNLRAILAEILTDVDLPNWITSGLPAYADDVSFAIALTTDRSIKPLDGHFICGPEREITKYSNLSEVRIAQKLGAKIGIGYYQVEAIANSLLAENLVENRLYSLCHGDQHSSDLFLIREGYFGWNIVFFRNSFFAAKISAGHFDLRSLSQEQFNALLSRGDVICFNNLQESLEALRPNDAIERTPEVHKVGNVRAVY
jgi:hypothetical protein